ncbi:MAG: NAD(P)H-quinone oxidoreductase subunit L [Synechococcaceae cyanobacterium SM2_3_1]|nr:NAD(P)H-quinone oxidoreductase subunit L [Synechococcaceae cyanobacterium SM2_3_1]
MSETLLILLIYGGLAGAYLLVIPLIAMIYIDKRFNFASSWEKVFMFFLGLSFFPGMLLVGGFINYRPHLRQL